MSPVEQRSGHAGKALLVAVVGVVAAIGTAFAVAVLNDRGTVDVRLGDDVARVGSAARTAETVAEGGPILHADLAGGDRDIVLQHLGESADEGWLALSARPPGVSRDCLVEWQEDDEVFQLLDDGEVTDECDGRELPPDGGDLPRYEVTVRDGDLYVDLWADDRSD